MESAKIFGKRCRCYGFMYIIYHPTFDIHVWRCDHCDIHQELSLSEKAIFEYGFQEGSSQKHRHIRAKLLDVLNEISLNLNLNWTPTNPNLLNKVKDAESKT